MSGDFMDPAGDKLTIEFEALDGGRLVVVCGDVETIPAVLELVEDAMRGAGFHVPHGSLRYVPEGDDVS